MWTLIHLISENIEIWIKIGEINRFPNDYAINLENVEIKSSNSRIRWSRWWTNS